MEPKRKSSGPVPLKVPAHMLVKVRHRDGRVEDVTICRAAVLFNAGQAEPEGEWTQEQAAAVLAVHERRQGQIAAQLARDGLLVAHGWAEPRLPQAGPRFNTEASPRGPLGGEVL